MSMRVRGKIRCSYQLLSLQHQPQVGSDWLERRVDVTPWTGHGRAEQGSAQGTCGACLLCVCVY